MKMLYPLMSIALLCAGAVRAEEQATRVIVIQHGNMAQIVHTIGPLLPGTNVAISNDSERLILRGPKETVTGIEEIVKQLDVSPVVKKNVETTVYLVAASAHPGSAPPVPAELDPVIKQLRGVFNYKGFRLLDSFVLRSRDGERGETSGFVPLSTDANTPAGHKIVYQFAYGHMRVDGADNARLIRFDNLRLGTKIPVSDAKGGVSYIDTGIATDVDVPEGKKVVVGKTSAVEGSDSALILVISAKVVD